MSGEAPLRIAPHNFRKSLAGRLAAAGVHLAVSGCIALVLILLVTKLWYPPPLFDLANGRDIFLLLIACDITLGPLMTLVIFNTGKSRIELARDVAIIAVVQIGAMAYGLSTLLAVRPAYIVYNEGQFNVALANELQTEASDKPDAVPPPAAPWFGPELVGARIPEQLDERNALIFSSVAGRGDIFQMPRYYVRYDEVRREVVDKAESADEICRRLNLDRTGVDALVTRYEKSGAKVGLLPVVIRRALALGLVDRRNGDLLGMEPAPR